MRRNLFRKGRPGPNVPPLGWGDISLYLLGMLLSGGLGAALLLVMVLYWDRVCALADPEALCTSQSANWLLMLAAVLLPLALCCIAGERLEHRYPIFGNPGYTYGGGDWDPVYPAMLRDENAPPEVRKSVRDARFGLAVWGLGLVLSVVLCFLFLTGGTRLYPDGSIRTTVGFGEVTAAYAPEQIERIFLEVEKPSSRNKSPGEWWELKLTFRTADNKLIDFRVHDFVTGEGVSEIDRLRELLAQYPADILRFENGGDLGRLYGRYEYDEEDQQYLEELFGVR